MSSELMHPIVHLMSSCGRQRPALPSAALDPLSVEQVMTRRVVALLDCASLRQALELFNRRDISGAPVLDGDLRLVGVITRTDLLRHLFAAQAVEVLVANQPFVLQHSLPLLEAPVRDYMTRELITVPPEATLAEACALLRQYAVRRLIVTHHGRVKGILSQQDVLRHLAPVTALAS